MEGIFLSGNKIFKVTKSEEDEKRGIKTLTKKRKINTGNKNYFIHIEKAEIEISELFSSSHFQNEKNITKANINFTSIFKTENFLSFIHFSSLNVEKVKIIAVNSVDNFSTSL